MKRKVLLAALLCVGLAAAGVAGVKTDFDHSVSFSKYHTFAWKSGPRDGMSDNSLVQDRVQGAVNREMQQKGFRLDNRNPDIVLSYQFSGAERQDFYPGRWHRWGWWGDEPYYYTEGKLTLDMTDAHTNRLVWRAYSTNTGDDLADVQKKADKLAMDALKKFPPSDKG